MGFTTLFGSKPRLNTTKFKIVEHGIEIDNVNIIEIIGITISNPM